MSLECADLSALSKVANHSLHSKYVESRLTGTLGNLERGQALLPNLELIKLEF